MKVLVVDTDTREARNLAQTLADLGHTPLTANSLSAARALVDQAAPDLAIVALNGNQKSVTSFLEESMDAAEAFPVIVTTRNPCLEDAVTMMKHGAQDFWVLPVSRERLEKTLETPSDESRMGRDGTPQGEPFPIISRNAAMKALKDMAAKVASSKATVFIQGESGTGKELFARFIHRSSARSEGPFVAVNCAALPENLLESELFGYEKGAFTGANKDRKGKFELAHGGTLLLDEVTEIPVHLQAKLLRVLQEGEVDRLGGRQPVAVDTRVIATTNRAIDEALKEGRFRKDLYYRLNVIPLKIPPLRERRDDIAILCAHFIEKYNACHGRRVQGLSPEALEILNRRSWPGNVRELENVVQRAVVLATEPVLTPQHLLFDDFESPPETPPAEITTIDEMEKRLIHQALDSVSGNRTRAAEILGISVRTLRNKLNEYRRSQGF